MGSRSAVLFGLGLFAACGGKSVYVEGELEAGTGGSAGGLVLGGGSGSGAASGARGGVGGTSAPGTGGTATPGGGGTGGAGATGGVATGGVAGPSTGPRGGTTSAVGGSVAVGGRGGASTGGGAAFGGSAGAAAGAAGKGSFTCPPGLLSCAGRCIDPLGDPRHCGGCGLACAAEQACSNGACVSFCPPGLVECGGACTDLLEDADNCGSCGATCPGAPNARSYCLSGGCGLACLGSHANCNGDLADGCEIDLDEDAQSCGQCGRACPEGSGCVGGTCQTSYRWRLVSDTACNAWCGRGGSPFGACTDTFACDATTVGGLVWIYGDGPTPPPNPVQQSAYGWVYWYCDDTGCQGPGPPIDVSCPPGAMNFVYQCALE